MMLSLVASALAKLEFARKRNTTGRFGAALPL
jgi:hypothetical protein